MPVEKYLVIRSIVEQQTDITYASAVKSISSYLRRRPPAENKINKDNKSERQEEEKAMVMKETSKNENKKKRRRDNRGYDSDNDDYNPKRSKTCLVCGKHNHHMLSCRQAYCPICGRQGHKYTNCTNIRKSDNLSAMAKQIESLKKELRSLKESQAHERCERLTSLHRLEEA